MSLIARKRGREPPKANVTAPQLGMEISKVTTSRKKKSRWDVQVLSATITDGIHSRAPSHSVVTSTPSVSKSSSLHHPLFAHAEVSETNTQAGETESGTPKLVSEHQCSANPQLGHESGAVPSPASGIFGIVTPGSNVVTSLPHTPIVPEATTFCANITRRFTEMPALTNPSAPLEPTSSTSRHLSPATSSHSGMWHPPISSPQRTPYHPNVPHSPHLPPYRHDPPFDPRHSPYHPTLLQPSHTTVHHFQNYSYATHLPPYPYTSYSYAMAPPSPSPLPPRIADYYDTIPQTSHSYYMPPTPYVMSLPPPQPPSYVVPLLPPPGIVPQMPSPCHNASMGRSHSFDASAPLLHWPSEIPQTDINLKTAPQSTSHISPPGF
jgi:hypothetical protein